MLLGGSFKKLVSVGIYDSHTCLWQRLQWHRVHVEWLAGTVHSRPGTGSEHHGIPDAPLLQSVHYDKYSK